MTDKTRGFETLALHAGQQVDPTTGARAVPYLPDYFLCIQRHRARRAGCSPFRNSATSTAAL